MPIPRSIRARLIERLIFNFRFKPEALDKVLPATWLKAQVCNGWSVVSFCILSLERVTLWPLPGMFGVRTVSCAYRCGAMDESRTPPGPTVYITDRQTDLPLVARLATWLLSDTILMVRPQVRHVNGQWRVSVRYVDGQPMFGAKATRATRWASEVFPTIEDFAHFIKGGVSSYTPSIYGDRLARVDLAKDEPEYEPLDADVDLSCLDGVWKDAGIQYDSAVRAGAGGRYNWTYRGLQSYA